ncbi:MAG: primosomal protein N', partial [Bacteroidales bacterium]|nr:primosomal protein N' [Bacteroidales bacterium]
MLPEKTLYAKVTLPLRLTMDVSYIVPSHLATKVQRGSFVRVLFSGRVYTAVVTSVSHHSPDYQGDYKDIEGTEMLPPASENELELWSWISGYYMCTDGEVFSAALPSPVTKERKNPVRNKRVRDREEESPSKLTSAQSEVYREISENLLHRTPSLLKGVTGSGKTEIYIQLAFDTLKKGESVLYMVPEIALSRQLQQRLERFFGKNLIVYHSGQSPAQRREAYERVKLSSEPSLILGLRSSVFLPFNKLGLIIIDEEHDTSYKQNEPAPRYHGRDTALMLAKIHKAGVVLGSATPSLESIYNCFTGRYSLIELNKRFYGEENPSVEIIDTIREQKRGRMEGLFSTSVLEAIKGRMAKGEQTLIFRNRRSYSPMVQCIYCGDIPGCIHCNAAMSYHKAKGLLQCHYCSYNRRYTTICTKCGKPGLKERGCGTEMIEEQIKLMIPDARVARFDSETTSKKTEIKRILGEFSENKTDILVGTQMISKGFDFENLTLIVLIQADAMFAAEDFRAGERALQMLVQLAGRGGRRESRGHIIVQTAQPDNK